MMHKLSQFIQSTSSHNMLRNSHGIVSCTNRKFTTRLHSSISHPLLRQWQGHDTDWKSSLILPLFVHNGPTRAIPSMPGHYQHSTEDVASYLQPMIDRGLRSVLLFGVYDHAAKECVTSGDMIDESPVVTVLRQLRTKYPDLFLMTDICLCGLTTHGHCGHVTTRIDPLNKYIVKGDIIDNCQVIDNERTIEALVKMSWQHYQAGAHMVAPSDMMDGRIAAIKKEHPTIPVLSYSAKFASNLYGPFRLAAESGVTGGEGNMKDRSTYQLPYNGRNIALRAIDRDIAEGADSIMVKPGSFYLDIVREAANRVHVPVSAYQVSGEYAMLIHAVRAGVFEPKETVMESLDAFRRAGATTVVSYFTPNVIMDNWEL